MIKKNNVFLFAVLASALFLTACTSSQNSVATNNTNNQVSKQNNMEKNTNISNRVLPGQEDLCQTYKRAIIKTSLGDIEVSFYCDESPVTVNNFMNLAKTGLYTGTKFHRVIKDFMIQGGDPNSKDDDLSNDGMGGPGYKFGDEFNNEKLVKGSLAMANSGPDTNGSQFFIVTAESTPWLDGHHVNFGTITKGMDVVAKIENVETYDGRSYSEPKDHPKKEVIVKSIELK